MNKAEINEEMAVEKEDFEFQMTPSSQVDPQLAASSSQVVSSDNMRSGVKRDVNDLRSGTEDVSSSHEDPLDMSSGPGGVKRNNNDLLSSADESESNTIRLGVGSVVNSLFSKARKKIKDVNLS